MKEVLKISFAGLDCAHCASIIEEKVNKLDEVEFANLNFINKQIKVNIKNPKDKNKVFKNIKEIVDETEPGVKIFISNEDDHYEEDEEFTKIDIIRFCIGIGFYISAFVFKGNINLSFALFLIAFLLLGLKVLIKAVLNIFKGNVFDENFLMGIASIGAFCIGEFSEAVAVMIFYQIGEYFQALAVNKSRKSIKALLDIKPEFANLIVDGEINKVKPEEVKEGALILVKAGEKIPLDGFVEEGNSFVDMSAIIGESQPREIISGDEVLSGGINLNGILKIKVSNEYNNSTVAKILELVENSGNRKSKTENFITRFAKVYTPIVVVIAVLLALVCPLIFAGNDFVFWLKKSLVFLVASCPCALILSIPLGFFSGIGSASRRGILIKGSNFLQALSQIDTVVLDKTGTLTKGVFEVNKINAFGINKDVVLSTAYLLEKNSNHPVAKAVVKEYEKKPFGKPEKQLIEFEEISGFGLKGKSDTNEIIVCGNFKLMQRENIEIEESFDIGSIIYVALNGKAIGNIIVNDAIKKDSIEGIEKLKRVGILKTLMLTGDRKNVAQKVAQECSIDEFYSDLLPQDKVEVIEKLYSDNEKCKIAFIGDGINDAPSLARADVGIAMGGVGSDAAIEVADVVIMNDEISKVADGIIIAKSTLKIVKQNIVFILAVKFFVLFLALIGMPSMWLAVFADVGTALIAIFNSMKKKI